MAAPVVSQLAPRGTPERQRQIELEIEAVALAMRLAQKKAKPSLAQRVILPGLYPLQNQIKAEDLELNDEDKDENSLFDLRRAREEAEKRAVIAALARCDGNIVKAAELLGVSRPTLYDLMHRIGITDK